MNLRALLASALLIAAVSACSSPEDLNPKVGMDEPIRLDQATYAEDFGPWLDTLPFDQQAVITGYIERADDGDLLPGERSWYEAEVTPAEVLSYEH